MRMFPARICAPTGGMICDCPKLNWIINLLYAMTIELTFENVSRQNLRAQKLNVMISLLYGMTIELTFENVSRQNRRAYRRDDLRPVSACNTFCHR